MKGTGISYICYAEGIAEKYTADEIKKMAKMIPEKIQNSKTRRTRCTCFSYNTVFKQLKVRGLELKKLTTLRTNLNFCLDAEQQNERTTPRELKEFICN